MASQNVHCDPSTNIYSKPAIRWYGRFGLGRTGSHIFGIRPTIKSTKIAFFENFIWGGGNKK